MWAMSNHCKPPPSVHPLESHTQKGILKFKYQLYTNSSWYQSFKPTEGKKSKVLFIIIVFIRTLRYIWPTVQIVLFFQPVFFVYLLSFALCLRFATISIAWLYYSSVIRLQVFDLKYNLWRAKKWLQNMKKNWFWFVCMQKNKVNEHKMKSGKCCTLISKIVRGKERKRNKEKEREWVWIKMRVLRKVFAWLLNIHV